MRGSSVRMLTVPDAGIKPHFGCIMTAQSASTAAAFEDAAGGPQLLAGIVDGGEGEAHPRVESWELEIGHSLGELVVGVEGGGGQRVRLLDELPALGDGVRAHAEGCGEGIGRGEGGRACGEDDDVQP